MEDNRYSVLWIDLFVHKEDKFQSANKVGIGMRVLFLHAACNGMTAEYAVHTTLAMNAKKEYFEPYFIWQTPLDLTAFDSIQLNSTQLHLYDFGRNMSIAPKVNQSRRAYMMVRSLPQTLAFLVSTTKKIRPDLIYTSQQYFDVLLASWLAYFLRIPNVIHIHYNVGPWLGTFALNAIRRSSRLIAVSEYIRQTALLQGVSSSNIRTVVNPLPLSRCDKNPAVQSIRSEFKLEEKTRLVVAVGRLDPGKGHLALFEAFAEVIKEMPDVRLLICGASTSRDNYKIKLQQRVKELGINPYVIFAGYRSDIPAILRSATVFCLPTELEPCGLVFLEAMEAGIPVVAYYSGAVPELVIHNQTGLLSSPGDIPVLAENLMRVLSDAEFAQRLGMAGRQRASIEFAPNKVADRWLKLLQEMVS